MKKASKTLLDWLLCFRYTISASPSFCKIILATNYISSLIALILPLRKTKNIIKHKEFTLQEDVN